MQKYKVHKHIRRSTIIVVTIIFLLAGGFFFMKYRISQVIKYLVENQSQGQYQLEMSRVHLSFLKRKVELTNVSIRQTDINTSGSKAVIQLPKLYLQLRSWNSLLFQKNLLIDSLYLDSPSFETFDDSSSEDKISFQTVQLFDVLKNKLDLMNVRSFRLQNGSFIIHPYNSDVPFEIRNINFSVRNFGNYENSSNRFMSADDIEVFIPEQDWKLNNGKGEIKFKQLQFSGRKQHFQLDSCEFISYGTDRKIKVRLSADKISFKSDSLSAFYESDELILDTLRCIHPVLHLHVSDHKTSSDTATSIRESLKSFFTNVRVRHLSIDDGQFDIERMEDQKISNYTTQKTNLKIDDLSFRPGEFPFFTTGNINMQLKELAFYTPDSLYKLTLEEFDLYNSDIRFKNAVFGPTTKNPQPKSFLVAIPVLALHQVDFEDLLEKRLNADLAEMGSPVVTIQSRGAKKSNESASGDLAGFYEALHGLSLLLHVSRLNIRNGSVQYQSLATASIHAEMSDFNASILLNDFLNSASLIDIKQSIPFLQVGQVTVQSKTMNLIANELNFQVIKQHNGISNIQLQLSNGILITGRNVYWHKLDWEKLKNEGVIIADSISTAELSISGTRISKQRREQSNTLPFISIRKLVADELNMHLPLVESSIDAHGQNILLSGVSTSKNTILWVDAIGDFTNVAYQSPGANASINTLHLETPGETRLHGISADMHTESTTIYATIPELNFQAHITSTDFSSIDLQSLLIEKPQLNFTQTIQDSAQSRPLKIPLELTIGELNINEGQMNYALQKGKDTIKFSSATDIFATILSIDTNRSGLMKFKKMEVGFSDFSFNNKKMNNAVAVMNFTFTDGNVFDQQGNIAIQSLLSGNWNNAAVVMKTEKGQQLNIANFSGSLESTPLNFEEGEKIEWKEWMNRANISSAKILFSDSVRDVSVRNVKWNSASSNLRIDSISLQPKGSAAEYFSKSGWQSDYTRLKGRSVVLSGIDFDKWRKDSILTVGKADLQNFNVEVSRDKTIPFQHGTNKLMPTQLLQSIKSRFHIDSIVVENSNIYYHEFSNLTHREGVVPIENINVVMKNVNNDHTSNADTLIVKGKAQLLNTRIRKFRYQEAYDDSLSSFTLAMRASSVPLTDFTRITNPLAAIEVSSGTSDTMIARISGNKYASIGQMQFYYHDLKIHMLNHEDTLKKRLSLAFVNFIANKFVIKTNNRKHSTIFFVRDQEKFVFSYWIKSIFSGILTSAGIKSNRKYYKQYRNMKYHYTLPETNF